MAVKFSGSFKPPTGIKVANPDQPFDPNTLLTLTSTPKVTESARYSAATDGDLAFIWSIFNSSRSMVLDYFLITGLN